MQLISSTDSLGPLFDPSITSDAELYFFLPSHTWRGLSWPPVSAFISLKAAQLIWG